MAGFLVARLDEIDEIDDTRCAFRPVRHHLGITTFGVNAMSARADGDRLINEHDHDESEPEASEELYVIMSGHATFEVDGEAIDAPAGTFVRVADEEGADRAQALIADDPPYGYVYYNTACFESRAERIDAAIAHLRRAVELYPPLKDLARDDEDLAALRDHAAFAEITGA